MDVIFLLARLGLAAVFVVAAIGKLMDLSGSAQAMGNFGVPARFTRLTGTALPILELIVAVFLIPVGTAFWAALLGTLLLLGFIAGISNLLRKGEAPDCHCFGAIHSEPVGKATLVRNGLFLVLAIVILAGGTTPGTSLFGWLSDASGIEVGLV
ncbi:MAG TPA: MauE/DoxX family redox-associated membrane protein, partial [Thermomicrobiales bacterium]|nr:MauE/DoxX family redox-associated membrane protein [Thermomicrobiales bacterium]